MKIDSVDSVTSYETESKPLDNGEKFQMSNKPKIKVGSSLSAPIYIPYKPVNPNQQAKKAYNYYIGRGVKPNVAAGIVGNLYKESGLNPNAVGDKGTAYGVAQWRGNRLSNLKNYAAKKGRSYSDLNTQLDYILDEQGENNVLKEMNNQTPEQAAMTFANKYERPNPKYADYSTRSSVAKQLGQMKYGGNIPRLQVGGKTPRYKPLKYKYDNKGRKIALLNDKNEVIREIDPATGRPKYGNPFKKVGELLGEAKDYLGKTYDKDGVLGVVDEVMSAPARGVTKAITGKYQDPSTALDIKNPYAKMAVDMVLDPTNLLPTAVLTKALKVVKGAKTVKTITLAADPAFQALRKAAKQHNVARRILQEGEHFTNMRKYAENLGFNAGNAAKPYKNIEVARKMSKADPLKAGSALLNDLINIDKPDSNKPTINNNPNIIFNTVNSNTPNRKKLPSLSNNTTAVQNKPQYSIPKSTEVQNTNSIVKPEASIDSVSLPSEEIYIQPTPKRRPRRHSESIRDYEDSFKNKPSTSGQHHYELMDDYYKRLHKEHVYGIKEAPKLIRNRYESPKYPYGGNLKSLDTNYFDKWYRKGRLGQLVNNPPKITKKALGGYLPKHGLGAGTILNLISGASTATAGLVDSFNDPDNPKQGLSAISGALQGNAAIPGVGLILGAVSGLKNAQKQKELLEKKEMMKNNQTMDYFKVRSKGILEDYNTQGNQGSFYAKGGKIANPQYEVEHGEVVMGDDVQLTGGQKLASNLHKVVGKTHEQYNPNTVNGTGEDGSGGEFIFSNRLKLGNKTFAQHAETIAKQKAKSEKASNHNDYIFKNTANANIELADSKLQQLAQIQEAMKKQYGVTKFAYGGSIPKFGKGGLSDLMKQDNIIRNRLAVIEKNLKGTFTDKNIPEALKREARNLKLQLSNIQRSVASRSQNINPAAINNKSLSLRGLNLSNGLKTVGKVLGAGAGSFGRVLNHPLAWLALGLSGDTSPTQKKPNEKPISSKVLANLQAQGFTPDKVNVNSKVNPNELTVAKRRALRNQNLAASTNSNAPVRNNTTRPVGNTNQQTPQATEPIVDNRINYEAKPLAIKQFDNTPNKLPDVSNRVDAEAAAKALSTKPGVGGGDKSKLDWTTAASGLMSGLNYMTNNNMINNYKTNVPVSLMQNPNYQYFDRSGLARHSVRGLTNSVMNNPFINQAGKQMAFANSLKATNEIEQQEANRKMDYDRQYRAQLLDTENRNSMILNRAREQQLANENTKLGLRQENLNNMFTNINTALSENAAMKSNERAMQYLGAAYINRLGITPEEFAKDPLGILTGKKENVDKQKMGGFIKLKGYKNASK